MFLRYDFEIRKIDTVISDLAVKHTHINTERERARKDLFVRRTSSIQRKQNLLYTIKKIYFIGLEIVD